LCSKFWFCCILSCVVLRYGYVTFSVLRCSFKHLYRYVDILFWILLHFTFLLFHSPADYRFHHTDLTVFILSTYRSDTVHRVTPLPFIRFCFTSTVTPFVCSLFLALPRLLLPAGVTIVHAFLLFTPPPLHPHLHRLPLHHLDSPACCQIPHHHSCYCSFCPFLRSQIPLPLTSTCIFYRIAFCSVTYYRLPFVSIHTVLILEFRGTVCSTCSLLGFWNNFTRFYILLPFCCPVFCISLWIRSRAVFYLPYLPFYTVHGTYTTFERYHLPYRYHHLPFCHYLLIRFSGWYHSPLHRLPFTFYHSILPISHHSTVAFTVDFLCSFVTTGDGIISDTVLHHRDLILLFNHSVWCYSDTARVARSFIVTCNVEFLPLLFRYGVHFISSFHYLLVDVSVLPLVITRSFCSVPDLIPISTFHCVYHTTSTIYISYRSVYVSRFRCSVLPIVLHSWSFYHHLLHLNLFSDVWFVCSTIWPCTYLYLPLTIPTWNTTTFHHHHFWSGDTAYISTFDYVLIYIPVRSFLVVPVVIPFPLLFYRCWWSTGVVLPFISLHHHRTPFWWTLSHWHSVSSTWRSDTWVVCNLHHHLVSPTCSFLLGVCRITDTDLHFGSPTCHLISWITAILPFTWFPTDHTVLPPVLFYRSTTDTIHFISTCISFRFGISRRFILFCSTFWSFAVSAIFILRLHLCVHAYLRRWCSVHSNFIYYRYHFTYRYHSLLPHRSPLCWPQITFTFLISFVHFILFDTLPLHLVSFHYRRSLLWYNSFYRWPFTFPLPLPTFSFLPFLEFPTRYLAPPIPFWRVTVYRSTAFRYTIFRDYYCSMRSFTFSFTFVTILFYFSHRQFSCSFLQILPLRFHQSVSVCSPFCSSTVPDWIFTCVPVRYRWISFHRFDLPTVLPPPGRCVLHSLHHSTIFLVLFWYAFYRSLPHSCTPLPFSMRCSTVRPTFVLDVLGCSYGSFYLPLALPLPTCHHRPFVSPTPPACRYVRYTPALPPRLPLFVPCHHHYDTDWYISILPLFYAFSHRYVLPTSTPLEVPIYHHFGFCYLPFSTFSFRSISTVRYRYCLLCVVPLRYYLHTPPPLFRYHFSICSAVVPHYCSFLRWFPTTFVTVYHHRRCTTVYDSPAVTAEFTSVYHRYRRKRMTCCWNFFIFSLRSFLFWCIFYVLTPGISIRYRFCCDLVSRGMTISFLRYRSATTAAFCCST